MRTAVFGATVIGTFAVGAIVAGSPDDGRGRIDSAAEVSAGQSSSLSSSGAPSAAVVTSQASRSTVQVQVGTTAPPPPSTTTPPAVGIPGDCESWRQVFIERGASAEQVTFFIDGGILRRETGCGLDTLNESTGDSGICQINPIHNRPGWFGGVEFGAGGWLGVLHGLRTSVDTDNPRWVDACITLFDVCGTGPWKPPYSCANRPLDL